MWAARSAAAAAEGRGGGPLGLCEDHRYPLQHPHPSSTAMLAPTCSRAAAPVPGLCPSSVSDHPAPLGARCTAWQSGHAFVAHAATLLQHLNPHRRCRHPTSGRPAAASWWLHP